MSNQRYMQRGVSASKEDVHNAIKNIDKGISHRLSVRLSLTSWEETRSIVTSCMPTVQAPSHHSLTSIGRKQAT